MAIKAVGRLGVMCDRADVHCSILTFTGLLVPIQHGYILTPCVLNMLSKYTQPQNVHLLRHQPNGCLLQT